MYKLFEKVLVEEFYEVIDVIEKDDDNLLIEELGDVFF